MPGYPRPMTETKLREWRTGQAGAEHLGTANLHLDGFEDIDPRVPLGGPKAEKGSDPLVEKGSDPLVSHKLLTSS